MSVNKSYDEVMKETVEGLVKNSDYDKATNHVTFNPEKLVFPEGVTPETVKTHVEWINDLTASTEQATAEMARDLFKENDKLTTLDATLSLGSFSINSQHHLSQQVGEEFIYGNSLTAVDYMHTTEQADWLDTQRTANQELATKLFG